MYFDHIYSIFLPPLSRSIPFQLNAPFLICFSNPLSLVFVAQILIMGVESSTGT